MIMKGVSIAIETVIFIILAVLVLTLLLFFFTSQSGPAQQQINLQRERNEICGLLVTKHPKCDSTADIVAEDIAKLRKACDLLKICTGGDNEACFKKCCIFCPK
jgi:hypothetical protein